MKSIIKNQEIDKTLPFEALCCSCKKKGWIGKDGFPNGKISERLFITIRNGNYCESCIDKLGENKNDTQN